MRLHVGCAMWSHQSWPGHRLPPTERLRHYASWCDAVEGNTTFYATPARDTVARWAAQTAPDFRFVLKLPKVITHERRLTDVDEPLRAFLDAIEPLGPRAHALWIQLPGSFAPGDVPALGRFLARLPQSHRYAVEVRHPAFFTDARATRLLGRPSPPPAPSGSPSTRPPSSRAHRRATRSGTPGPRSRACRCGPSR